MQEPQTTTEGKLGHLFEILGNFPSIKNHSLTSCAIKSQRSTDFTHETNRKWVTWQEKRPCFRLRRAATHSILQREMYDSAKMVSVSALNFGNNLLRERERIWKQFVIVQPSFLFFSNESYSNYWPFQSLNGISKHSGMPLLLSNGTF